MLFQELGCCTSTGVDMIPMGGSITMAQVADDTELWTSGYGCLAHDPNIDI